MRNLRNGEFFFVVKRKEYGVRFGQAGKHFTQGVVQDGSVEGELNSLIPYPIPIERGVYGIVVQFFKPLSLRERLGVRLSLMVFQQIIGNSIEPGSEIFSLTVSASRIV